MYFSLGAVEKGRAKWAMVYNTITKGCETLKLSEVPIRGEHRLVGCGQTLREKTSGCLVYKDVNTKLAGVVTMDGKLTWDTFENVMSTRLANRVRNVNKQKFQANIDVIVVSSMETLEPFKVTDGANGAADGADETDRAADETADDIEEETADNKDATVKGNGDAQELPDTIDNTEDSEPELLPIPEDTQDNKPELPPIPEDTQDNKPELLPIPEETQDNEPELPPIPEYTQDNKPELLQDGISPDSIPPDPEDTQDDTAAELTPSIEDIASIVSASVEIEQDNAEQLETDSNTPEPVIQVAEYTPSPEDIILEPAPIQPTLHDLIMRDTEQKESKGKFNCDVTLSDVLKTTISLLRRLDTITLSNWMFTSLSYKSLGILDTSLWGDRVVRLAVFHNGSDADKSCVFGLIGSSTDTDTSKLQIISAYGENEMDAVSARKLTREYKENLDKGIYLTVGAHGDKSTPYIEPQKLSKKGEELTTLEADTEEVNSIVASLLEKHEEADNDGE